MKTIESTLRKELSLLKRIMEETEKRLKFVPKGQLRISNKENKLEYYLKSEDIDRVNGRYMKKSEMNLVKRIAQRDYDINILKNVEERIKVIETFLDKYKKTSLEGLYEKTNIYRRELIDTPIISDEEFIKRWQAVEYSGKMFNDDTPMIITERGERVRSKSEKIIADKLYMLGIPYRYEYPILLDGNVRIYPDFTILRMPEREEVYLEHFGMMDDEEYVNKAVYKINTYERNGIYLGMKLFITQETSKSPLNTKALDGMLREVFLVE